MPQIDKIPLAEALDLHPHTTLDYMTEWFAHEASRLDEDPLADEEQLTKAVHCRAWALYLAIGLETLQGQPTNTPALYCPHCLANFANLTHVGAAIVVRDEHPEFTQDDVAQEMQCQNCATSFYIVPNSAEHQHEWVDREGGDFCGHCFVARKQTKPSNLSGLL